MPSSVLVGGMRMSVSTTSGLMLLAGLAERELIRHRGDDLDLRVDGEQLMHALAHDQTVLPERDADRHEPNPRPIGTGKARRSGEVVPASPCPGEARAWPADAFLDRLS